MSSCYAEVVCAEDLKVQTSCYITTFLDVWSSKNYLTYLDLLSSHPWTGYNDTNLMFPCDELQYIVHESTLLVKVLY